MPDHPIVNPAIEAYMDTLLPARDEVLVEMEAEAQRRHIPIIGPAVGRWLAQLVLITRAKHVFELGSAIGYSTIWLARAVGESGRVVYTDGDRKNADEARRYFERAGVSAQVDVRVGDALELMSEDKGPYDLIFNDVDKEDYPRVLRLVPQRLRTGGLFVTDNTLWHGRVLDADAKEAHTRAVLEFNRTLYTHPQFYTTMVPLRDGVAVALKIG